MPNSDESFDPRGPEDDWKNESEEEQQAMQIPLTPDQLSAMARSRQKLNRVVTTGFVAVAIALEAALLYNVYKVDMPWIRLGQAWTLGVLALLLAPAFDGRRGRMRPGEACAQFLIRQHDERRRGYLRIRRLLVFFLPGIVASWWGGGPLEAAKARGLDPSSWQFHFYAGPWLFLIVGVALALSWLGFGKAAEKAARDREEVRRDLQL